MTSAPSIAQFSLHQRDATIATREAFARDVADIAGPDVLALTTCHRIEIVLVLPEGPTPQLAAARVGVPLPSQGVVRVGRDALVHLMRMACGLDSVIRGEGQVLGQLRRAFDAARTGPAMDPVLALVIRRVLEFGRELRRTTALGTVTRSLGSLAVDAALDGLPEPAATTVLVVGAGEMGTLALRALGRRVGTVIVVNRDQARAVAIAGPHGATVLPLDRIDEALDRSRVVIAAADSRGAVLTVDRLQTRLSRGGLTLVDLAVPRSVGAEARRLEGLRYIDVDGLSERAGGELDPVALADIEARCERAADAVLNELDQRRAAPAIRALSERTESIRRRHVDRALGRLAHLCERDRDVVESLSLGLAHALMHEPTVRLREAPDREAAARELFGL